MAAGPSIALRVIPFDMQTPKLQGSALSAGYWRVRVAGASCADTVSPQVHS